jgi:hypothetical protein
MTSDSSPGLDEAFERLAASGFELPNGFVNHGPMACEALDTLGLADDIDEWARRFARSGGLRVEPRAPAGFEWQEALGAYDRLPEWIGHFEREIDDQGWLPVVEVWVPRLMPALAVALFHGAIRAAHAVRAIDAADTAPRRAELARALGYWAARFRPGQPTLEAEPVDDVRLAVTAAAAYGARRYLARPNIFNLHGVTGAMAVELFVDHVPAPAALAALAQVHAEHASMYRGTDPMTDIDVVGIESGRLARSAADSRDPHQVKLVEACRRGLQITGDPAFEAAAETVTGGRRRTAADR